MTARLLLALICGLALACLPGTNPAFAARSAHVGRTVAATGAILARISLPPGKTLSHVAQWYYGDANLWGPIARANGITNTRTVAAYRVLVVPVLSRSARRAWRAPPQVIRYHVFARRAAVPARPRAAPRRLAMAPVPRQPQPRRRMVTTPPPVTPPPRRMGPPVTPAPRRPALPPPQRVVPQPAWSVSPVTPSVRPRLFLPRPTRVGTSEWVPAHIGQAPGTPRRNPFKPTEPVAAAPVPIANVGPPSAQIVLPPPPVVAMPVAPAPTLAPLPRLVTPAVDLVQIRFSGLVQAQAEPTTAILEVRRGLQSDYVSVAVGDRVLQSYTLLRAGTQQVELLRRDNNVRVRLRLDQTVSLRP